MNHLFDGNYHLLGHTKELNHTPNDEKHLPKHEKHHLNHAKHTWKDKKYLYDNINQPTKHKKKYKTINLTLIYNETDCKMGDDAHPIRSGNQLLKRGSAKSH